ncbi:MAG: MFS transporter [Pseudomonadota bacterium]
MDYARIAGSDRAAESPLPQSPFPQSPSSIAERLDRLSLAPLHIAIVALCTLGLAADIGEVALSNTFSAIFLGAPYHASHGEVSRLLAAVFAGGAVGAPILGWWGDRGGRRMALQGALLVLAAASFAVALSPNIGWMTGFRFVSGLALGAYPPLTAAYLADVLPPKRRGITMMLCASFAFLGAPAVIFLIRWLTPLAPLGIAGWRWALVVGVGISAAVAGLFFLVPESPRWLATRGAAEAAASGLLRIEAGRYLPAPVVSPQRLHRRAEFGGGEIKSGFGVLIGEPKHFKRILLLAALYALAPWATIGFPLLSTQVLVQKGFHLSDSLLFAAVSMFGPTLGIGAVAFLMDRLDRRLALGLCAALMAGLGLAFAVSGSLASLIALGAGFNLAGAVYSAVLSLYGAELFATHLRAFATSGAWGIGRAISILVPIVLLPVLGRYGPLAMFAVIVPALLVSLLLIVAGPPGRTGQPIDERSQ